MTTCKNLTWKVCHRAHYKILTNPYSRWLMRFPSQAVTLTHMLIMFYKKFVASLLIRAINATLGRICPQKCYDLE